MCMLERCIENQSDNLKGSRRICPVGKLEDEHTIINMIFPVIWNMKLGLSAREAENVRM